ncbi:MAG: D-Ala-D-Ala carboxypeptidase family metallohydrolase, partial [Brevinema sp.]
YFFNSSFRLSSFGGETDSNHMSGYAADIALSPEEKKQVLKYIKENMINTNRIQQGLPRVRQVLEYPSFIHIDVRPDGIKELYDRK